MRQFNLLPGYKARPGRFTPAAAVKPVMLKPGRLAQFLLDASKGAAIGLAAFGAASLVVTKASLLTRPQAPQQLEAAAPPAVSAKQAGVASLTKAPLPVDYLATGATSPASGDVTGAVRHSQKRRKP